MSANGGRTQPEDQPVFSLMTHEVIELPTRRRPIDLATQRDVRREMASVYRDARANRIAPSDATRLIYCLREMSRVLMIERQYPEQGLVGDDNSGRGGSLPVLERLLTQFYAEGKDQSSVRQLPDGGAAGPT